MPLTFPTMAEKALAEFRAAARTVSLATIAKQHGADVERSWPCEIVYTFDDDTSLRVTGRGRAHKVEVLLP